MKLTVKRVVVLVLLGLFAGCVTQSAPRQVAAGVKIIVTPTAIVRVSAVDAYVVDGQLVVVGKAHVPHNTKQHGHLDIAVTAPSGNVVNKTVNLTGLLSKRRGAVNMPFRAVFEQMPPAGSTVKVTYHRGSSVFD